MRSGLAYTGARVGLFAVALGLLYLAGERGLWLFLLALLISGLASFVLLSRQRDRMSASVSSRLIRTQAKAAEFRARLEEGAAAEDVDAEEAAAEEPEDQQAPAQ
jgi:Mn2+/Fe2+ NRAMP family transporter